MTAKAEFEESYRKWKNDQYREDLAVATAVELAKDLDWFDRTQVVNKIWAALFPEDAAAKTREDLRETGTNESTDKLPSPEILESLFEMNPDMKPEFRDLILAQAHGEPDEDEPEA